MGYKCAIKTCPFKGKRLCTFPKDPHLRNIWLSNAGVLPGQIKDASLRICIEHFIEQFRNDIKRNSRLLHRNAYPTLHLPGALTHPDINREPMIVSEYNIVFFYLFFLINILGSSFAFQAECAYPRENCSVLYRAYHVGTGMSGGTL